MSYTDHDMTTSSQGARYRFGVFEADAETGELRKQGLRIKLGGQPFQILLMLLAKQGELVTREEIQQALWPEGTFVDFDHGLNSAINRIREALGDSASSPRFLETLARKGYRFLAPVDRVDERERQSEPKASEPIPAELEVGAPSQTTFPGVLASPAELPKASHKVVRTLFLLLQLLYLSFYIATLANLREVEELVSALMPKSPTFQLVIVTAAIMIPVRLFLMSAITFRAPGFRSKFLRLFPVVLIMDELWSLSPFLLLHHIEFGLALAATAALVYSPFAQRSLVLMAERERP